MELDLQIYLTSFYGQRIIQFIFVDVFVRQYIKQWFFMFYIGWLLTQILYVNTNSVWDSQYCHSSALLKYENMNLSENFCFFFLQ